MKGGISKGRLKVGRRGRDGVGLEEDSREYVGYLGKIFIQKPPIYLDTNLKFPKHTPNLNFFNFYKYPSPQNKTMPGELECKILEKLREEFSPNSLNIENVSYLHFGHDSIKGNTSNETHFKITITSDKFKGVSMINRHKMVYKTLDFAFKMGLHALELKCEV